MKTIHYIYIGITLLFMASCGDYNENLDGYCEDNYKPTDIKNIKYELTNSDYEQISKHVNNNIIKSHKFIPDANTAHEGIALWLQSTYPTADNGSKAAITYWQQGSENHFLAPLTVRGKAATYTIKEGDDTSDIDALLKNIKQDATANDIIVVLFPDNTEPVPYQYTGKWWNRFTASGKEVDALPLSVYNSLGTAYIENADDVLPVYMKNAYPYAKNEDTKTVLYYHNKYQDYGARQYLRTDNEWQLTLTTDTLMRRTIIKEKISAPFELTNGTWAYNPSMTITLPKSKTDATTKAFYQAVADWVWANIDSPAGLTKGQGYVSKWGNNEYYTGSSAYNGCVEWLPTAAKSQNPAVFEGMTDEEIITLMQQNLITVYAEVLKTLFPEANTAEGMEVIYTINFTAMMPEEVEYTIQYKVTASAEFTYIDGSMRPL